jgi:twitching motility protein PilI
MTRTDLKEFQQGLAERLRSASRSEGAVWLGMAAGEHRYLLRLEDAGEVLPLPQITPVPCARPWFLGLANVRGKLVCVSDLAAFLGESPAPHSPQSRLVLCAQRFGAQAGLAVNRMLGLRTARGLERRGARAPYSWVGAVFADRDENGLEREWRELELAALLTSEEFLQAGL